MGKYFTPELHYSSPNHCIYFKGFLVNEYALKHILIDMFVVWMLKRRKTATWVHGLSITESLMYIFSVEVMAPCRGTEVQGSNIFT